MYVRSKLVKGFRYFQLVEGRREGGKVRQHILCSLGQHADPRDALKAKKKGLAQLKRRQEKLRLMYPEQSIIRTPLAVYTERDRLKLRIGDAESEVELLAGWIKDGLIGTTPKRKDD